MNIISFELKKTCDIVSHSILVAKLRRYGQDLAMVQTETLT